MIDRGQRRNAELDPRDELGGEGVAGVGAALRVWGVVLVAIAFIGVGCSDPSSSLRRAASRGDKSKVQELIASGVDLEGRDEYGNTALHLAVLGNHVNVVKVLLAAAVDVGSKDKNGWTPLHRARTATVARLLLKAGADPNARDSVYGSTPLARLVSTNDGRLVLKEPLSRIDAALRRMEIARCRELARTLLRGGADVNSRSDDGWTPLHGAVAAGHIDDVRFLLENGADPLAKTKVNTTPLQLAVSMGKTAIAPLIEKRIAELRAARGQ